MELILIPQNLETLQESVPGAEDLHLTVVFSSEPLERLKRWREKNHQTPAWVELRKAMRNPIELLTDSVRRSGPPGRPILGLQLHPSSELVELRTRAERVLLEAGISFWTPPPLQLILGRGAMEITKPFLSRVRFNRITWRE